MKNIRAYFSTLSFGVALRILLLQVLRKILMPTLKFEFSYGGENSILNDLFGYKESGFYLDVGCNHPIKSSNTFLLYLKGWNGIAIDANAHLIAEFKKIRKKDIAIHAAVSDIEKDVNYYDFDADLLNTIKDDVGTGVQQTYGLKKIIPMRTQSLTAILKAQGINSDKKIDLLSIDVEGLDFEVLKSLDLTIYRPFLIMIEIHHFNLEQLSKNDIYNHLKNYGYLFIGFISMNAYFKMDPLAQERDIHN